MLVDRQNCSHAENAQVDFEVDRPPPANSSPGDLLITMVKETVVLYKRVSKNEKKSLIDLKMMKKFEFLIDECVSDHNARIRLIQIDKNFISQTFRMYNFIINRTVRNILLMMKLYIRNVSVTRSLVAVKPPGLL